MKQELCSALCSKYPELISNVPISCGDGWLNLIDALFQTMQFQIDQGMTDQIQILDIKSKLGALDITLSGNTKPFMPLLMLTAKISRSISEF